MFSTGRISTLLWTICCLSHFRPARSQKMNDQEQHRDNASASSSGSTLECNICLEDVAQSLDPVITQCGHLYCWPCLYRWMNSPQGNACPVCKAAISRQTVIPLYGKGRSCKDDPRMKDVPERPHPQRTEAQPNRQHEQNAGLHVAGGFGLFPGLFGMQFAWDPNGHLRTNMGTPWGDLFLNNNGRPLTEQEQQQQFITRALLALGLFLLFVIFFL